MDLPYSAEEIDAATNTVVAENKLTDGYIRPIAWRGWHNFYRSYRPAASSIL